MYHQKHLSVFLFLFVFSLFLASFLFSSHLSLSAATEDVVISEIMFNPEGSDSDFEWIELYNSATESATLVGGVGDGSWRVVDGTSNRTLAEEAYQGDMTIESGGFLILAKNPEQFLTRYSLYSGDLVQVSGISLGNTTDNVGLKIDDVVWSEISYESNWVTEEGYSVDKIDLLGGNNSNNWTQSKELHGSPGLPYAINQEPHAVFTVDSNENFTKTPVSFNASDSYDEDGTIVSYAWDFGEGSKETTSSASINHTYAQPGKYDVMLTVTDNGNKQDSTTKAVTIQKTVYTHDVVISEFLPAPGNSNDWDKNGVADANDEWIELFNNSDVSVNLTGWMLDDEDGGSAPFVMPDTTLINPHAFFVFYRSSTGVVLNNDMDKVRLLNPDGELVEEIEYSGLKTDEVFAKGANDVWQVSNVPTLGAENIFPEIVEEVVEEIKEEVKEELEEEVIKQTEAEKENTEVLTSVAISQARSVTLGTVVKITGVVTATPELLGSRTVYLQDETGGLKVKLLENVGNNLELGDKVTLVGKLSQTYQELYLDMESGSDLEVIEKGQTVNPEKVTTGSINEGNEGKLVRINGKVVETSGDTFFIDDGSGKVKVYIKEGTGIDKPYMRTGYYAEIIGVVSQYNDEYRVLPRYQTDVLVSKESIVDGSVLGITSLPDTGSIALFTAVGMIMMGLSLRMKRR